MKNLLVSILVAGAAALACGGCAHTDSDKKAGVESVDSGGTLGQQLIDLKKAYKDKAISKRQYEEQKKKLLKGY